MIGVIGIKDRRFGFGRVVGINGYGIACDGFTGEIILGGVGSGNGAAVAVVSVMAYWGR